MRDSRSNGGWPKILWGLAFVGLLWMLAVFVERDRIQADLKQRADMAFRQAGLDWARAQVDGRRVLVVGEAYSKQEQKLAQRLAEAVWGVSEVADASALATLEEQYVWTAAVEPGALRLMGFYPNGRTHRDVLTAARQLFPEHQLSDQMRPARGAPRDEVWLGAIEFGLAQLTRLEQGGRVNLRGTELAVAGVATSVRAYRSIKGALYRGVPAGVILVKDKVKPPTVSPYTWHAEFKNGQLVLGGHAPSEGDRDALIATAKQAFKNNPIIDKMAIAAGQPREWIAATATIVLQLSKLENGAARLDDTKLVFGGVAHKQETAEKIRADLRSGLASIYKITHELKFREATIPTVSPFVTRMEFDGLQLSLSGNTPSSELTQRVLAAAKNARPKLTITGSLAPAKGAPEVWITCMLAGLQAVLQLENGRFDVTDRTLSISGLTRSEEIAETLPKQVRAAANRACTETVTLRVEVPPEPDLNWRATFDEKVLRLSGEVPGLDVRKVIIDLAAKLYPKAEVIDDLKVANAKSEKWPKIATKALELLAKLRRGSAQIDGTILTLRGEASDTATQTAIHEQLKAGLAKGYEADVKIEVKSAAMLWAEREAKRKAQEAAKAAAERRAEIERKQREAAAAELRRAEEEAKARRVQARAKAAAAKRAKQEAEQRARDEAARQARANENQRKAREAAARARRLELERCQSAIDETMQSGTIVFARGSAKLDASSFPTLDRLVGLSGLCGRTQIEIGGHTDSSGSESRNQELSEQRARSVRDYLVNNGMRAEMLTARGYGESRPLAPNTTAVNRAKNRRIEIRVRVN